MQDESQVVTIHGLARLAMERKIETVRFGSDGRTAVIKYKVGPENDRIIVEKRIQPTSNEDGVDVYDVSFLGLKMS